MKIGFDNEKYLKIQSEHIRERISQFGGKLYHHDAARAEGSGRDHHCHQRS